MPTSVFCSCFAIALVRWAWLAVAGTTVIPQQCPAGRVFQYRVGSGRVLDKIPGIGSGSGRVGVSKYAIGYFRVSLLLSGIFGYFGYFRVISGIFGYFRVFLGISGIYGNVG